VRTEYPILQYQDTLAVLIFVGAIALSIGVGYLYWVELLPWYFTVPLIGIFISFLHELEHDIIHDLYFKQQRWVQHIMFMAIWISKGTGNPWWRKHFHIKHHKVSGQVTDIEERLIGLGVPFGLKRILLTLHGPLGIALVAHEISYDSKLRNSTPGLDIIYGYAINAPAIVLIHLILLGGIIPGLLPEYLTLICWKLTMVTFFPNMVRQACLALVSTGCHYYGDIPEKNVFYQNQILNHWIFYPFQLFCCNFGETHILHHYVTRQPFYLRQLIAPRAIEECRRQGVRINDLDIFRRAHRWQREGEKPLHDKPLDESSYQAKALSAMAS